MCVDVKYHLEDASILRNTPVAPELFHMVLHAPGIAAEVLPGQFVHMGMPGLSDRILRRPFSVFEAHADGRIEILYRTVGRGTAHMAGLQPGIQCSLVGPIGKGWQIPADARHLLLVGGGLGAAPLFMLCRRAREAGLETEVVLGATTECMLVCRRRFADVLGHEPLCSTDDGSFGYPGFATAPADSLLRGCECADGPAMDSVIDYVAVCGPYPLMRAVAASAARAGVPCEVSLERRMACGIGACLGCSVETVDGRKRACVDGPVFDAAKVMW